jgi:hypothetical protein
MLFKKSNRPVNGSLVNSVPLGVAITLPYSYKDQDYRIKILDKKDVWMTFLSLEYWNNKKSNPDLVRYIDTFKLRNGKLFRKPSEILDTSNVIVVGEKRIFI